MTDPTDREAQLREIAAEIRLTVCPHRSADIMWASCATCLLDVLRRVDEEARAEEFNAAKIFRDLLRRAQEALGGPLDGPGSSWHDIPERITTLRAELDLCISAAAKYIGSDYRNVGVVQAAFAYAETVRAEGERAGRGGPYGRKVAAAIRARGAEKP